MQNYKSRRIPIPMNVVRERRNSISRRQERQNHRRSNLDFERKWVIGAHETLMSIHGNLFARSRENMVTKSMRPSLANLTDTNGGQLNLGYSQQTDPGELMFQSVHSHPCYKYLFIQLYTVQLYTNKIFANFSSDFEMIKNVQESFIQFCLVFVGIYFEWNMFSYTKLLMFVFTKA